MVRKDHPYKLDLNLLDFELVKNRFSFRNLNFNYYF